MVVTLAWWGMAVAAPALLAARALKRGRKALAAGQYDRAEHYLDRAGQREPLRETALCLMAEAAIRAHRPADAILALDGLFEDRAHGHAIPASRRAVFLRGIACLALRQGPAAQHALGPLAEKPDASPDEILAMAHACVLAGDTTAARVYLAMLHDKNLPPALRGRAQLCAAAALWLEGRRDEARQLLPPENQCAPADAPLIQALRHSPPPISP